VFNRPGKKTKSKDIKEPKEIKEFNPHTQYSGYNLVELKCLKCNYSTEVYESKTAPDGQLWFVYHISSYIELIIDFNGVREKENILGACSWGSARGLRSVAHAVGVRWTLQEGIWKKLQFAREEYWANRNYWSGGKSEGITNR